MRRQHLFILGAGGWGTALAVLASRGGHKVTLWSRRPDLAAALRGSRENADYLPGVKLPAEVEVVSGDELSCDGADAFICAIPTQHLRATLTPLSPYIGHERPILSCSKGIENGSLQRASEVVREAVGRARVTAFS